MVIEPLRTVLEFVHVKKREARYARRFAEANAEVETFVLSFPKSGRTWHRVMVGFYLARISGAEAREALDLKGLCRRAGLPRVMYSHNAADISDLLPATSRWIASPELWRGRKVVLLVREPKAVLVSAYHHCRFRSRNFSGALSEFIRDPRRGIDKIAVAHQRWHANRHLATEFKTASYEEMHRHPEDVLRQSLILLGIASPDETLITEAVRFGRFDNMKQQEDADFFNHRKMRARHEDAPPEGSKIREGTPDSYKSHLSEVDATYIDRRLAELGGNPFAVEAMSCEAG